MLTKLIIVNLFVILTVLLPGQARVAKNYIGFIHTNNDSRRNSTIKNNNAIQFIYGYTIENS
jgi:hypothetical protein